MALIEDLEIEFKTQYDNNPDNIENALFHIKKLGAKQIQCTMILVMVLRIPLNEARSISVNSKAWAEKYAENMRIDELWYKFLSGELSENEIEDE